MSRGSDKRKLLPNIKELETSKEIGKNKAKEALGSRRKSSISDEQYQRFCRKSPKRSSRIRHSQKV